jgi:alpha-D-ribose 1-methylphosphonate 5-triphosphate diphosphatase
MGKEKILHNAHVVLPNKVVCGSLVIAGGKIIEIDEETYAPKHGIDCRGDYLIPGLIEIHTDNLEKHIVPRPGIYWPSMTASIIAHDNQVFNSGITTVLDAIFFGWSDSNEARSKIMARSIAAVQYAQSQKLLRADHFLHFRCELPSATVWDSFCAYMDDSRLKLVSIMDHTPGQRQWWDLSKWRLYHKDKKWTDEDARAELDQKIALQQAYSNDNRRKIVEICREREIPMASHDDTTSEHCQEAWRNGITISEFPTTLEAAHQAKSLGMATIMGAPNMVRGESHSGNISAQALAERGLLDGFSSDYMPISLLHSAFELHRNLDLPLFTSLATVTANIAKMVNLSDRGVLEEGKKADIIRVKLVDDLPIIKTIWKNGRLILNSSVI